MTNDLLLPAAVYAIPGFLSQPEAELLYTLALQVPKDGVIVEIGSYQGKSTVCLGLGAKQAGAWVWAIDPHDDYQESETTHYGMENHAALLKNLVDFGVADVVRVVALKSMRACGTWYPADLIHLLWIDGLHDYQSIADDLTWSGYVVGKIAIHDSSGNYPDVTKAVEIILSMGEWVVSERVDAAVVLERAK